MDVFEVIGPERGWRDCQCMIVIMKGLRIAGRSTNLSGFFYVDHGLLHKGPQVFDMVHVFYLQAGFHGGAHRADGLEG